MLRMLINQKTKKPDNSGLTSEYSFVRVFNQRKLALNHLILSIQR